MLTTTPKPRKMVRDIIARSNTVVTRGSTLDNLANLSATLKAEVLDLYAGTRFERQEIYGELIGQIEGALFDQDTITKYRVAVAPADLSRVVIGVDPAGGGRDETGIVAVAKGADGHGYVLADRSGHHTPETWARLAVDLYCEFSADKIVAEKNFGGDMVASTIRAHDATVPIKLVTASRGKAIRAEPIAARYEQGRVHHVGVFRTLEEQMADWTSDSSDSPDRMDALVWGLTEVLGTGAGSGWAAWVDESLARQTVVTCPQRGEGHLWRDGTCVACGGRQEGAAVCLHSMRRNGKCVDCGAEMASAMR